MKNKFCKIGLKWRIFLAFAGFAIVAIMLLWIFYFFMFDSIYQQIRSNQIMEAAKYIEQNLNSDIDTTLANAAETSGLCLHLFDIDGNLIGTSGRRPFCPIHGSDNSFFKKMLTSARDNGGTYFAKHDIPPPESALARNSSRSQSNHAATYLFVKVVGCNGVERVIVIDSAVTPLDATVSILKTLLITVTLLALIIAAIIAGLLASQISRPIERINKSAKGLPEGKFDYEKKSNIPEIEDLANTLTDASVEIARTEDLKKELFANVCHDLRTPLTMITGYSEVMRDIPGENTPENVQVVIDEANRLTRIVNDMLDISIMQSTTEFEPVKLNITNHISEILTRYNKMKELEGYTVNFHYDSEVFVMGDETRLSQVIYNLVNNAIDFTGEDKTVNISQITSENSVRIEVSDSGPGIPAEMQQHIWQRYYKSDSNRNRMRVGTGLGLSIVKESLIRHNARYGVESSSSGSTFWFELDIAD